jgi:hypothetical protein
MAPGLRSRVGIGRAIDDLPFAPLGHGTQSAQPWLHATVDSGIVRMEWEICPREHMLLFARKIWVEYPVTARSIQSDRRFQVDSMTVEPCVLASGPIQEKSNRRFHDHHPQVLD